MRFLQRPSAPVLIVAGILAVVAIAIGTELIDAITTIPTSSSGSSVNGAGSDNASGSAFASKLLASVAVPAGARLSTVLPLPLEDMDAGVTLGGLIDVHHEYLLRAPLDLRSFLRSRLLKGALLTGPSSASGTNINPVTTFAESLPFANRHISLEEVDYTVGSQASDALELRVDVLVAWQPIRTVIMPTSGTATLTVYRSTSLVRPSSEPLSLALNRAQVSHLAGLIASLSNTSGGTCMEDSTVFTISVRAAGASNAFWRATGDACPGDLNVTSSGAGTILLKQSCALRLWLGSILPSARARTAIDYLENCPTNG